MRTGKKDFNWKTAIVVGALLATGVLAVAQLKPATVNATVGTFVNLPQADNNWTFQWTEIPVRGHPGKSWLVSRLYARQSATEKVDYWSNRLIDDASPTTGFALGYLPTQPEKISWTEAAP